MKKIVYTAPEIQVIKLELQRNMLGLVSGSGEQGSFDEPGEL